MTKKEDIRPDIDLEKHPISTGGYQIATPEIYELSEWVRTLLFNRCPGAIIPGRPRYGKSEAISYLIKDLKAERGKDFPVFNFDFEYIKNPNELRFFEQLLKASGHKMAKGREKDGRSAPALRERLKSFLPKKIKRTGSSKAVFFIDEAQNIKEDNYLWLVDVHNCLTKAGISPLFLLFGQPELVDRRETYIETGLGQIVGRFMVNVHEFNGLQSPDDIATCLQGYDESATYPKGSNWTFTRYFFTAAFKDGWRLANESEKAWDAFMACLDDAGVSFWSDGIPMLYFALTVEYLMRNYSNLSCEFNGFSLSQWKEAIDNSNFVLAQQCIDEDEDT